VCVLVCVLVCFSLCVIMVALCNRADHYIFIVFFSDCRIYLFSSLAARVFNKLTHYSSSVKNNDITRGKVIWHKPAHWLLNRFTTHAHSNKRFLKPTSTSHTTSQSFSSLPVFKANDRDRQTDHATPPVQVGRIYIVLPCGLTIIAAAESRTLPCQLRRREVWFWRRRRYSCLRWCRTQDQCHRWSEWWLPPASSPCSAIITHHITQYTPNKPARLSLRHFRYRMSRLMTT